MKKLFKPLYLHIRKMNFNLVQLEPMITHLDATSDRDAKEILEVLDNIRNSCDEMEAVLHRHTAMTFDKDA